MLSDIIKRKGHICLFDNAYQVCHSVLGRVKVLPLRQQLALVGELSSPTLSWQGYSSGDAEEDAKVIRFFMSEGHNIVVCQSYSKVRDNPQGRVSHTVRGGIL